MPRHYRRRGMNGASLTGLVNADARTEAEIRGNVRRVFGTFLALVMILDILSSILVVWLSCGESQEESNSVGESPRLECLSRSLSFSQAFRNTFFHHRKNESSDNGMDDNLGDFVLLSALRCMTMLLLLWTGVHFGREGRRVSEALAERRSRTETNEDDANENPLTEPLLVNSGHPDSDEVANGDDDVPSSNNNGDPLPDDETVETANGERRERAEASEETTREAFWTPQRIRTLVLLLVFVCCTIYQVYAGLRVATMGMSGDTTGSSNNNNNTLNASSWMSSLKTILICLTILWINAEAYIVRVLILELTRKEEGLLFLPPEVHRHPLYLETDHRSMAFHYCDLCQKRISVAAPKPKSTTTGATCRVASTPDENKSSEGWCYRCALCDFDICLACSRRNDAATVGENVLRGDRGVRAETSLTTGEYVKRSIAVAGESEWPWLLLSFALLAVSSLSKLFLPHFQGKIIDKVIPIPYHPGGDNDDDDGGGGTYYDKKGFLHYIFIYVLVMLAQGAVSTLYSAIFTLVSRRLKFTIRNALLEKILAQDVAYFDGTESGRLISRLTNDLDMMMAPIQSSLSNLLSNCLILIGGMAMCFFKSYRLSMLAFVTIGPISYLWEQYALWSKKLAREMLSYWAQGNSVAAQALSHIRTVKAFGCEEVVLKEYSETNQMALNCGIKDAWGNGLTSALTGYLDLGTGILILYFGGLLVYHGEMSVGDLVTYQLFWNMMNNAYQSLQGLVTSFTRSAAGAEKVFSLWDSQPDIDPTKGSDIRPEEVSGHIQLQNVSFYYQMRPDHMVLENFDLEIPAGKTLALVGRSGGGKSTIINLLLRFYDPREGSLVLDGKPYESLKVHQLRKLFGVVTQDTELFALTVEENIAYGLEKDSYTFEEVVEAAKKAYAHDFICQMKDGYQTRIGERGSRISGGQRQRLAIARVFLRKPRIILLDEATSALDENSQEAVQKALAVLIEESQSTVVMVAHRLSTVVNADSICVIDKGRVLEQGSHQELANKPGGIYASMVNKQLSKQGDFLDQEGDPKDAQKGEASESKSKKGAADTIDDLLADGS
eukprot:CAMPEP_0116105526 /NCGR_PEP_ID=MMETSP0327-20121206/15082_1 /TAXON_ID=44447 /ORGANISM="Pseudo-nitzschia delicatissima, Strain B596" /LENGTH=1063 /DNA_ID=CAMNT_0003597943 /DNA_START=100 /DNA_END=3291 /DNA_ORIENTATION=+